jgi:hypothetical protein
MTRNRGLLDILNGLIKGYVPINIYVCFDNNRFSNNIFVTCTTSAVFDIWLNGISDSFMSSKKRDDSILVKQVTIAHQRKKNISFNFDVSNGRLKTQNYNSILEDGNCPQILIERLNDTSKSSMFDTIICLNVAIGVKNKISFFSYFNTNDCLSNIPLFLIHSVHNIDSIKFVSKLKENSEFYLAELEKLKKSSKFSPLITLDEFVSLGLELKKNNISIERIAMLFYRLDIKDFEPEFIISNILASNYEYYFKGLRDKGKVTVSKVHKNDNQLNEKIYSSRRESKLSDDSTFKSDFIRKIDTQKSLFTEESSTENLNFIEKKLSSLSMFEMNSNNSVIINTSHSFYLNFYRECNNEQKKTLQRLIFPMLKLLVETNNPKQVKIYEEYLDNLSDYIDEIF